MSTSPKNNQRIESTGDVEKEVKKSYTQLLLEHLDEECEDFSTKQQKVFTLIKGYIQTFSNVRREQMEKEREDKDPHLLSWGMYSGRRLDDLAEFDPKYIKWLNKNRQYLTQPQKTILTELILK